jgi:DNA polymerase III subunit chi
MTRIDFHTDVADKITYCCSLVRKAHARHARLIVLAGDRDELATLDQALWTFSEPDFLPHVVLGDELTEVTPIVLSDRDDAVFPHHHVLVNLAPATPGCFARFERLIELVGRNQADQSAGRTRYRFYRERGYPIDHHKAGRA